MSCLGLLAPTHPSSIIMDPNDYLFQNDHSNMLDPNFHLTEHHQHSGLGLADLQELKSNDHGSANLFSLSAAAAAASNSHQTSGQQGYKPQGSPSSTHSTASRRKGGGPLSPGDTEYGAEDSQALIKRQRNTMAARKYRQKRLDRIADLERALGDMTDERDKLKIQLARKEAEVEALREMLSRK